MIIGIGLSVPRPEQEPEALENRIFGKRSSDWTSGTT